MNKTNDIELLTGAFLRCFSAMINMAGSMQNEINAVVTNGKQKAQLIKKLELEVKTLAEAYLAVAKTTPPLQDAYKKEIKRYQQLLNIASDGGKATAHYTYAQTIQAFTDYKRRNPNKTAWDAANALIRPGAALAEKWHHVNSPWNSIKRIAKSQQGITRDEWYSDL